MREAYKAYKAFTQHKIVIDPVMLVLPFLAVFFCQKELQSEPDFMLTHYVTTTKYAATAIPLTAKRGHVKAYKRYMSESNFT